jgi:hypothetical protein
VQSHHANARLPYRLRQAALPHCLLHTVKPEERHRRKQL